MAKAFLDFDAGSFLRNVNRQFAKNVKKEVIPAIIKRIQSGNSPVRGAGAYDKYSESYKKAIRRGRYKKFGKQIRPINLTLSGKMLRAFKVRALLSGGVSIYNSNKLAKYHNDEGAGASHAIRKMLPNESGMKFTKSIQDEIDNQLERAIAKEIRK